jgi:hypothetical protein
MSDDAVLHPDASDGDWIKRGAWDTASAATSTSTRGAGWKRDNSFLSHRAKGSFCCGFYPHGSHPAGNGGRYRATAEGPGVTPDVTWQGLAPGSYDQAADATANASLKVLDDPQCRPRTNRQRCAGSP